MWRYSEIWVSPEVKGGAPQGLGPPEGERVEKCSLKCNGGFSDIQGCLRQSPRADGRGMSLRKGLLTPFSWAGRKMRGRGPFSMEAGVCAPFVPALAGQGGGSLSPRGCSCAHGDAGCKLQLGVAAQIPAR